MMRFQFQFSRYGHALIIVPVISIFLLSQVWAQTSSHTSDATASPVIDADDLDQFSDQVKKHSKDANTGRDMLTTNLQSEIQARSKDITIGTQMMRHINEGSVTCQEPKKKGKLRAGLKKRNCVNKRAEILRNIR